MSSGLGAATLADEHDCLLLDLDGTVYRGAVPTAGAVETLEGLRVRTLFLTNNASRSAVEVADHMRDMGFAVDPADIVTSAHTAARLMSDKLPQSSKVLVIGTDALATEVADAGLAPVRSWDEAPVAVVQGHSPRTNWAALAEAALAIRTGALWVACNIDPTFPTERGLLPGNGAMVAALRAATGAEPIVVGKPESYMIRDGLGHGRFESPLVVGDRLETDIAGATVAGLPSLLVFSGVATAADVVDAEPDCRPTYIGEDLTALAERSDALRVAPQPGWHAQAGRGAVTITSTGEGGQDCGLSVVRAAAHAVWSSESAWAPVLLAGDDDARRALEKWGLLNDRQARVDPGANRDGRT
ncbi:HAD family hydrolase [Mycobacterium sp. E2327]|uniref:HAD-IIA family hydrolase n=1 Tax=Mycobacterium sp. E2327 TaxID=1834132 RepID=UPI0008020CB7|nr:HAD-IIA family hydrolase [Mycobacterium sp. E2327]OBI17450.1 HAD family hydrolase [Mycobacterium sp. E2327]